MKLFAEYLKPLKEVGIESIAKETLIDEYSKKLKTSIGRGKRNRDSLKRGSESFKTVWVICNNNIP